HAFPTRRSPDPRPAGASQDRGGHRLHGARAAGGRASADPGHAGRGPADTGRSPAALAPGPYRVPVRSCTRLGGGARPVSFPARTVPPSQPARPPGVGRAGRSAVLASRSAAGYMAVLQPQPRRVSCTCQGVSVKQDQRQARGADAPDVAALERRAVALRRDILEMLTEAQSGHPGGSLSAVELVVALYFGGFLRYDPNRPDWEDSARFILS